MDEKKPASRAGLCGHADLSGPDVPGGETSASPSPTTSAQVPASMRAMAAKWEAWKNQQRFTGRQSQPDSANPEQMNRFTWYQAHDWTKPYPGDSRIYAPNEVPGGSSPAKD